MKTNFLNYTESRLNGNMVLSLVIVLLFLLFTGCEQTYSPTVLITPEDPEIEELAKDISNDLTLSQAESQRVRRAFMNHHAERRNPGYFWIVAAELHKDFTEEQMERVYALIERYEAHLAENGKFIFFQGWPALTGQNRKGAISCAPNLTDEQIEKMRQIRRLYAEELEALKQQFRAGKLTEAQYRRAKQALITALQQEFFELLTDEQKARWRRCMAMEQDIIEDSKNRAFQVMVRVLQLNRQQHSELVSLQLRLRNRYHELIREFRADIIEREEFVDEIWSLRDKHDERLREILTTRQYEIVKIHQALIIRNALNKFRHAAGGE